MGVMGELAVVVRGRGVMVLDDVEAPPPGGAHGPFHSSRAPSTSWKGI